MNTTENNQLIASFLGQTSTIYDFPQFGYINSRGDWSDTFSASELKFHKDWNWLMEVVDKIESLDFNFNITSRDATVLKNHGAIYQTLIYRIDGTKKIKAVYNTCVEFIKWYNQQ
jgi:hypothetical protein